MNFQQLNQVLILVDVQKGFLDVNYWGQSNNPNIEKNILKVLGYYRHAQWRIVHIQHLSTDPTSPLRPGQQGSEIIESCKPILGERIFQKSVNSAFIGTNLEQYLRAQNIESIVLVGFTTDHCVSTTARMASNLGFQTIIIEDCTATFNRQGMDSIIPAALVHSVSLASLNKEFATIINSDNQIKL